MTQASGLMSGDYVSDWTAMLELRKVPHYSQINYSPAGQRTWTNDSLIKFLSNVSLLFQIVCVNNTTPMYIIHAPYVVRHTQTTAAIREGLSRGIRKYVIGSTTSLGESASFCWIDEISFGLTYL